MKNKYKILVLSDLKNKTDNILKSTVSLAKTIKADVEFFHVKKPTDVVEKESQLSAMRAISKEHIITDKKIKALLDPISKDYGVKISSNFTLGNIKNEIEKRVKEYNPDVIVLGKRKASALKLLGDNVIDFVLKNYQGTVLIAGNQNVLEPEKTISLGMFNTEEASFNNELAKQLFAQSKQPLKAFRTVEKSGNYENKKPLKDNKIIEFVFEKNDNTVKSLSNYLQKNNINLLCLNRRETKGKKEIKGISSEIKEVINKLNISMLLTNESALNFQ